MSTCGRWMMHCAFFIQIENKHLYPERNIASTFSGVSFHPFAAFKNETTGLLAFVKTENTIHGTTASDTL